MEISKAILDIGKNAKLASKELSMLSGKERQDIIEAMVENLIDIKDKLFEENEKDVNAAIKENLSKPLIKRLTINEKVFIYMLERLKKAAILEDPVGRILEGHTQPNGLLIRKISIPIGVISIIYESRPNVTTDAAAVCIKSGNAVILRGGSESLRTNLILANAMRKALKEHSVNENAIQMIENSNHKLVDDLLKLDDYIDLLIPRGGKALIKKISEGTKIPILKHYEGICHYYLAEDASEKMSIDVVINSKCQSIEVCNALETLLIDKKSADYLLIPVIKELLKNKIEVRLCEKSMKIIKANKINDKLILFASEDDWRTEYLAPILSIKIVDNIDEAIVHIDKYGSGHTDGIVSNNNNIINQFVNNINSSSVMINASTRLSGGGDYGLGAVVGISTDKLHARGPVGPNELTTYKWIVYGNGHLRK